MNPKTILKHLWHFTIVAGLFTLTVFSEISNDMAGVMVGIGYALAMALVSYYLVFGRSLKKLWKYYGNDYDTIVDEEEED